jgi:hypothetical protein
MGTWILGTSKTQYSPQMINKKKHISAISNLGCFCCLVDGAAIF